MELRFIHLEVPIRVACYIHYQCGKLELLKSAFTEPESLVDWPRPGASS